MVLYGVLSDYCLNTGALLVEPLARETIAAGRAELQAEIDAQLGTLNDAKTQLANEIEELQATVTNLKLENGQKEEALAALREDLESKEERFLSEVDLRVKVEHKVHLLTEELSDQQSRIESLITNNKRKQGEIEERDAQLEQNRKAMSAMSTQKTALEMEKK
jgi:chromosome segregation ATPase